MGNQLRQLTDEEVQKLFRIVKEEKGKRRCFYVLGLPVTHVYTLNERIDAIRRLGKSRNRQALDGLKGLVEFQEEKFYDSDGKTLIGHNRHFPNAGALADIINHSIVPVIVQYSATEESSVQYRLQYGRSSQEYSKVMDALCEALSQLEEACKQKDMSN